MSKEEKSEKSPSKKKPSPKATAKESPPKAPEPASGGPPPPAAPAAPRKEDVMLKPLREGSGNFVAMMALAVALGSLVLSAFFAYAKGRPAISAARITEVQVSTGKQLNALSSRVAGIEASVNELQAMRGRGAAVNTLDLKKALVSLREVGRHTSGATSKKVEQVEGALKALINELEAKGQ